MKEKFTQIFNGIREKIGAFFSNEKKRNYFILGALVLALVIVIILSLILIPNDDQQDNPSEKQQYKTYSFSHFDTVSTIVGYEVDGDTFDEVAKSLFDLLGEYHKLFDIYNEYEGINNLYTINSLQGGEHKEVEVDRRIIDMLLYAKDMHEKTNGEINVAMGSVLSIWHDYRTAGIDDPSKAEIPPMELLEEAKLHTDINNLIIDEERSTVYLSDPKMKLDVGAIAKGYAVEMLAQLLIEKNISGYVINVGGNIRVVGPRANGSDWKAGIENPDGSEDPPYIEYVGLTSGSIVTSGSYQRYYTVGGKRYHHIIDKDTLMPATGLMGVSVICESSALGDGLSTALFCMSLEDGMALVNSIDGVEAIWTDSKGEQHYSDNFNKYVYKN